MRGGFPPSRLLLRALCLLGCGLFGILPANAQTNTVWLNGFEVHPTRILAKFKAGEQTASPADLANLGSRVSHQYRTPRLVLLDEAVANAAAITTPGGPDERLIRLQTRLASLKSSGRFEYVEPDYIVKSDATPTDQAFQDGRLWGLQNLGQDGGTAGADISATNAWDITTGSNNVIVAVIDTGVRYTHQDLVNQMWVNPGEIPGNGVDDDDNGFIDDVHGIDAIGRTGDPYDTDDHGTHVSGTIGAAANDGNPHVGVAWQVQIMGCKFLGPFGGTTSDAIICIDYAVEMGARILNNSWGGGAFSFALFDSINNAGDAGVLFVAAAGNNAINNDLQPHYPSSYTSENIIAVAATDRNDQLADFSHYGLQSVDVGAPGVSIFSSISTSDTAYDFFDGTSMAAPHVSGVAALILSEYPAADLLELKSRILLGVDPLPSLFGRCTTGGRLNAYNSLTISGNGILQLSVTPPSASVLLAPSTQPILAKVTDLFGVRDATVTATISGAVTTNLTFLDDGVAPDATAGDAVYSANFYVPASTGSVTMTITASHTNQVSATNVLSYTILPPPPNDYFTNATKVTAAGGQFFSNNRFGTLEPNEPTHAAVAGETASLWWSWTAGANTNAFVDTTGSSVNTVVAVYTGSSLTSLRTIAATNDVGNSQQGYVSFPATNGATYRIAVASANSNSLGSIQLRIAPGGQPDTTPPTVTITSPLSGLTVTTNLISIQGGAMDQAPNMTGVSEVRLSVNGAIAASASGTTSWNAPALLVPGINTITARSFDSAHNGSLPATIQVNYFVNNPVNDIFANSITLTQNSGVESGIYTTNATKEIGEPNHAGNAGGKSAWWKLQAPADGELILSTTNSTFDTLLAVYQGTTVGALTSLASNDDAPEVTDGTSALAVALRSNQVYCIAVDGYDAASGAVSLQYLFTPATVYRVTVNNTAGGMVAPASVDVVSNSTAMITATPDEFFAFAGWTGDFPATSNPLSVVVSSNLNLTANFQPVSYSDDFETGNLSGLGWASSGNVPWLVQTNTVLAGSFSARSGIINHSQTSSLLFTTNFASGVASFYLKVSSEPGWDFLKLYLDDNLVQQWSGEVGWVNYLFNVPGGLHTLEWRYTKDANNSAGLDAAFIDNLSLPFGVPIDATTPAQLQIVRQPNGSLLIQVLGQTNQQYVIQGTTSLAPPSTWQNLSTNIATGGVIEYQDPDTSSNPLRFYRAVVPVP